MISNMLAEQYFQAGDYPRATQYCFMLVESDTTDLASWLRLADMAVFSQQYPRASQYLTKVLQLDSVNLKGLIMMGEILDRIRNTDAIRYYRKAYISYPANQVAAYALATWHVQSGDPRDALPVCAAILEMDSSSVRFCKLQGYAHYKASEPRRAITLFERTLALGDSSAFTYKYLGISQYIAADMAGAVASLEEAVRKDTLDAESHFFLGACLANTREKGAAMKHLDRSISLVRPDPQVLARIYSEKGNLLRLQEQYEAAYQCYRQAWEADTTQPMSLYYMASILDNSLHRSEEALADYQRFIDRLDRMPVPDDSVDAISVRDIVEDRIISLKEELFFLDR
jgi:tetratricopeptide (TPR) repeat protein